MNRLRLQVVQMGVQVLLQDLGRPGHRQHGVALGGAVDPLGFHLANLLAGNPRPAAALEVAFGGFRVQALTAGRVGVAGLGTQLFLNGTPLEGQRAVWLHPGDQLQFGFSRLGARAYLAAPGGFDVPEVLGSRSTHLRSGLGPPPVKVGDVLTAQAQGTWVRHKQHLPQAIPSSVLSVRALKGPEWENHPLLHQAFEVSRSSDRMGARLQGKAVQLLRTAEMLSVAVLPGTVQLPSGGQPIVLLADAQTTGGYPRVLQVIQADLWKLGQALPGQRVQFQTVDFVQAEQALAEQHLELQKLQRLLLGPFA